MEMHLKHAFRKEEIKTKKDLPFLGEMKNYVTDPLNCIMALLNSRMRTAKS